MAQRSTMVPAPQRGGLQRYEAAEADVPLASVLFNHNGDHALPLGQTSLRVPSSPSTGRDSLTWQLGQPPLEKPPLRLLLSEAQGAFVRRASFLSSPQSPAQIRSCRMREVIVPQIAPCEDTINEHESRRRAVTHCHSHSPIQLDHRGGIGLEQ